VREVHLLGAGATSFAETGRSPADLARTAIAAALADAQVAEADVGGVSIATGGDGVAELGGALVGDRAGRPLPPVCVSGAAALHVAWQAVATGAHDVVVCVGHECRGAGAPAADGEGLAALAAQAEAYMAASGATEQDLARVVVKNRGQGADAAM
jgi:acetyl-CoA acetyltransferase